MANKRNLIQDRVQQTFNKLEPKTPWFHAWTGDLSGNVLVSGYPGYIYITDWSVHPHIAFNGAGVPTDQSGYLVRVGYDNNDRTRMRILGMINPSGTGGGGTTLPLHHRTHEDGNDQVWLQSYKIVNGTVTYATGLSVYINPFWMPLIDGTRIYLAASTLDLTSHVPATGARWVVICYSMTDGSQAIVDGDVDALGVSDLMNQPIPGPIPYLPGPDIYLPLAAVALYAGQTEILQSADTNQIIDLRLLNGGRGGAGGASAFTDLTDVPASYVSSGGMMVKVKLTEDGLEFAAPAAFGVGMVKEDWTSQVDGKRSHFTTSQDYIPGSLVVIDKGLSETPSVTEASLVYNSFDLDYVPAVGHQLFGWYFVTLVGGSLVTSVNGDTGNVLVQRQVQFSYEGELNIIPTVGAIKIPNLTTDTLTILKVQLHCNVSPGTNDIIVDINKNGTTVFTNQTHRPRIVAGATSGYTTTIDVPSWAPGDVLTMDVDASGLSPNYGSHLSVTVLCNG